ncbi:MAG: glycoside hydrolase family 27 protein [Clostridia bacterium]|nr:glycoside hydrolase family 27 protein [Clostridia bacterium]
MKDTYLLPKDLVAKTPPMGWNSWDCYAATVNEEQLIGNAEYMAKYLKEYGWEYIVCDIQWSDPVAGSTDVTYINFAKLNLDEYGRQIPPVERFPSAANGVGFRSIADRIHEMGLKFGIHIMRGIPRQAVHARLPVLGTNTTADRIADPFSVSRWNGDMYGVLNTPEGQAYYDSIFRLYAEWGVDFVKVDDICNTNMYPHNPYSAAHEVEMIARAIERSGRPMVLSLSPGPAQIDKQWHLTQYANMWRITDDFWDDWRLLKEMFWRCEVWCGQGREGCWPDCDMLPLGKLRIGFHDPGMTRFTKEEQRTVMTLWSIFRSPLIMGGEMRENDDWTLSLLTNRDVLRLIGHSHHARQLQRTDSAAAWHSYDEDGSEYLALFNLSDEEQEISAEIDFGGKAIRELWGRDDLLTGANSARIPAHGAILIHAK